MRAHRTRASRRVQAIAGLFVVGIVALTWALSESAVGAVTAARSLCPVPPPPCSGGVGSGGTGVGGGGGGSGSGVLGGAIGAGDPHGALAFTGVPLALLCLVGAGLLFVGLWTGTAKRR